MTKALVGEGFFAGVKKDGRILFVGFYLWNKLDVFEILEGLCSCSSMKRLEKFGFINVINQ